MATRSTRSTPPAAGKAADPGARVLRRFRLVFNAVKSHFRAVENKAGVSGAQLWALHVVREQPGIGVGGLARAMDIHQSTASNLLRSLLEKELVASDRAGDDRRAVQLRARKTLARLDRDLGALIEELGVSERGAGIPLGAADE
jgi:DNA-binding MarR family transcriptional regulator